MSSFSISPLKLDSAKKSRNPPALLPSPDIGSVIDHGSPPLSQFAPEFRKWQARQDNQYARISDARNTKKVKSIRFDIPKEEVNPPAR